MKKTPKAVNEDRPCKSYRGKYEQPCLECGWSINAHESYNKATSLKKKVKV
jgi:hypothetical protein